MASSAQTITSASRATVPISLRVRTCMKTSVPIPKFRCGLAARDSPRFAPKAEVATLFDHVVTPRKQFCCGARRVRPASSDTAWTGEPLQKLLLSAATVDQQSARHATPAEPVSGCELTALRLW